MNWYLGVLKKYAEFGGQAQKAEYWFFFLFTILVSVVLGIIDRITGSFMPQVGMGLLGVLYSLAVFIPTLAVSIRRLHDTGRSGWWLFIGLIPLVGVIVLIIFMVQDSNPGENQYGPNPKLVAG